MNAAERARLQELVEQWRKLANDLSVRYWSDCAEEREMCADELAACLAAEGEEEPQG